MKPLDSEPSAASTPEKAPYRAPRLTAYGSLRERTKGGEFFGNDGNNECTGNANAGNIDVCNPS